MLNHILGVGALVVPAIVTAVIAIYGWRGRKVTVGSFYVANRSVGIFVGACSMAVAWLWIFVLLVAPLVSYQQGWQALAWFTVPNTLGLCLGCFVSWRIVKRMHRSGYTLPQFLGETYGPGMRLVAAIVLMAVQGIYAVLAQLVGAEVLLQAATGLPNVVIVLSIAVLIAALAMPRGVEASIRVADMVKTSLVVSIAVLSAVALFTTDHAAVSNGLKGIHPVNGLFDAALLSSFGVPVTISLLAGGSVDQQVYQRAFSLDRDAKWAFVLAPLIFLVLCVLIGALGFVGAGEKFVVSDPQLIGFAVMRRAFSPLMGEVFVLAVAASLIATGAAALNAASSVWTVDVVKAVNPDTAGSHGVKNSRFIMGVFVVICVCVFFYNQHVQVKDLQLWVGPFRAGLLVPVVVGVLTVARRKTSPWVARLTALGIALGTWTASDFWPLNPLSSKWLFWAGVLSIVISGSAIICEWYRSRTPESSGIRGFLCGESAV